MATSPLRPVNCPACKHGAPSENCGIQTFTASQLGAVAALILGGIFYLIQLVVKARQTTGFSLSQTNTAIMQSDILEMLFSLEFWAILFLTALYYAIGEWAAEEEEYHELRKIKWPKVEFWLRVGLAAAFGIAAAGTPEPFRFGLRPLHASAFVLILIYFGFICWDLIVYEGGKDVRWKLISGDVVGAILILIIMWTHQRVFMVALFTLLGSFGLSLVFLVQSLAKVNFGKRVLDRNSLR